MIKTVFEDNDIENYLVFWKNSAIFQNKPKWLSDKSFKVATSNKDVTLSITYIGNKIRVKFDWNCLNWENIYLEKSDKYLCCLWQNNFDIDFELGNSLFWAVKLN